MSGDGVRSPTAVRRALGRRLRELRIAAGLTVDDASELVEISQPKLTKIERAQVAAARDDVLKLIAAYGGVSDEEQEQVLAMVRDGNRKEWWEGRDLRLLPKLGSYLGLEAVATALQASDSTLVPGLPPTQGYSR